MSGWLTFEALPGTGGGLAGSKGGSIERAKSLYSFLVHRKNY